MTFKWFDISFRILTIIILITILLRNPTKNQIRLSLETKFLIFLTIFWYQLVIQLLAQ